MITKLFPILLPPPNDLKVNSDKTDELNRDESIFEQFVPFATENFKHFN